MSNNFTIAPTVRCQDIEPDANEDAIIIHYEVEAVLKDETTGRRYVERKRMHKRVNRIDADPHGLALEIIQRADWLLNESKLPLLIQVIRFMQQRQKSDDVPRQIPTEGGHVRETASMDRLDDYIELLYDEEMASRVKSTSLLLQLAKNPDNLEELAQNETLLQALSRLLREESKRSMELATSIISIFFCFSSYSQFCPLVNKYRGGDVSMRTIDLEIQRYEIWQKDAEKKGSRVDVLVKRQEQLLFVCFHLLLNVAEDPAVEVKMVKRGIVKYLVTMLDRKSDDLLILVATFLKKLSVFKENKDAMRSLDVGRRLCNLLPTENEGLLAITLRLGFNLSFDSNLRVDMIENGLIPKLVELLKVPEMRLLSLRVLYQLSQEDKGKSLFSFTADGISLVLRLIHEFPSRLLGIELAALGVNLALNQHNAEELAKGDNFPLLMTRALQTHDPLLMKMLRNMSQHETVKEKFLDFVEEIVELAKSVSHDEDALLVEVLGILSNFTFPNFDFAQLVEMFQLIPFLEEKLSIGIQDDDVLLEAIMIVSLIATDPKCGTLLAHSSVLPHIVDILQQRQDDDEIVLQIVYAFSNFLLSKETRDILLQSPDVIGFVVELHGDKNPAVRAMADSMMDLIVDIDETWAKRILTAKFKVHNQEWLSWEQKQIETDDLPIDDEDPLGLSQSFSELRWNPEELEEM